MKHGGNREGKQDGETFLKASGEWLCICCWRQS